VVFAGEAVASAKADVEEIKERTYR